MPCSPGKQAGTERRQLSHRSSSTLGGGEGGTCLCYLPEPWFSPPQVIVHGNGFPFLCSMVLFAVTAERFACAITHPRTSLWARSGVACPPRAAAAQPHRAASGL